MYEPRHFEGLEHADPTRVRLYGVLVTVFSLIALALAFDVADDLAHGADLPHVLVEALVVAVALVSAYLLGGRFLALRRQAHALQRETQDLRTRLAATEQDAQHFRTENAALLRGLGAAIDAQLERWQLSTAEREVALLLLKGLSHKEIAAARQTSEPTVRQQAQAVYRKAGVTGRADLAAFFLEDLLVTDPSVRS